MNYLKIESHCTEEQMQNIVLAVEASLYLSSFLDVESIDREFDGLRICIDYEVWQNELRLVSADLYQEDTGWLYEDTAVLNSRLRSVLTNYNRQIRELIA